MTLSHPAAVVPLRALGLPMSAMVIGSMVPDIPVFLRWQLGYDVSHGLLGVATVDVVATLLVLAVWFAFVRDAVVDLSPSYVRARLAPHARLTRRQWLLAPLAAGLGALTHTGWDAFTHYGRWGPEHIVWLRQMYGDLPGLKWAQYISGVVGLIVVAFFAVDHLRRLPARYPADRPRALGPFVLPGVVGAAAAVGLVSAARQVPLGLHQMAFYGVVNSLIVCAFGLTLASTAWQLASRRAAT